MPVVLYFVVLIAFNKKDFQYVTFLFQDYPLIECLSGEYEMREFRPDLISEILDDYLIPSKMR